MRPLPNILAGVSRDYVEISPFDLQPLPICMPDGVFQEKIFEHFLSPGGYAKPPKSDNTPADVCFQSATMPLRWLTCLRC